MSYESKTLPAELRFYVPFNWDNKKVWALELPVERAQIRDWEWHLNLPFWSTVPKEPRFDLKPRLVCAHPLEYPIHWNRIQRADTSYPLDTFYSGDRWVILDGIHRLARLVLDGAQEFQIRRVPESAVPLIRAPDNN